MKALIGIPLIALALWLGGCAVPEAYDDPAVVMLDRAQDPARRLAAAQQLGPISTTADPKQRYTEFHDLLWSDAQPTTLRLLALDRLLAYDTDGFWRIAQRRIREVDRWEVLNPLIEKAAATQDPALTPMLIRSVARPSTRIPLVERPELEAIERLNPDAPVEGVLWDVFASPDRSLKTPARIDAWSVFCALYGQDAARQHLDQTTTDHPLIQDLHAARWLGHLPVHREGILWLMRLRSDSHQPFWASAEARAAALPDELRDGLRLRHLPALLLASDEALQRGRDGMIQSTRSRLPAQPAAVRTKAGIARELPSEAYADHLDQLRWADLLILDRLLDAMRDRGLAREFFRQADADRRDTTTEHGGVLDYENGEWRAIGFTPSLRVHDQKFHASDALIQRMYTGLCHYHFHVQSRHNAEYAGPGVGDLKFAENLDTAALVLTFLDENTLNVDYYQPGGVVIDLGVIKR